MSRPNHTNDRPGDGPADSPEGAAETNPDRRERRLAWVMISVFSIIVILAALDLIADLAEGTTGRHALVEGIVIVAALAGLGTMARRLARLRKRAVRLHREARDLSRALRASQQEAARWREEAHDILRGLGEAIDRQFARWELTPAEKEVALLLLKGLSHKDIASVREVSQATARQQAGAVYKKAGVAGRHDLSAFFLEDLLLPGPNGSKSSVSGSG